MNNKPWHYLLWWFSVALLVACFFLEGVEEYKVLASAGLALILTEIYVIQDNQKDIWEKLNEED